jgi:sporulation protein YlmC with PRC-barrel domain
MTEIFEAHVEQLLGRRVRDVDGRMVGRLEELRVEIVDGESVVTEYHLGRAAALERIAGFVTQLPFFRYIPFARKGYRVPWAEMDLSDPQHPMVRVPRAALEPITVNASEPAG